MRRFLGPATLALLSIAAAIALWVGVTEADDPTRQEAFNGSIEVHAVNTPTGLAVASIREPVVSLRVSANQSTLSKLTTADFRAEIDLSGVRQNSSDQIVIARVVGNRDVQIVQVTPSTVTVNLEPEATKIVPVVPTRVGSPPQGYAVTQIDPAPLAVRVTGATSLIQLVDSAAADVNLTGVRITDQRSYVLTPRDARGGDIRGVRVEPAVADIKATITQQETTLLIPVLAQIQGSVADGYNLVAIATDPPAVSISGPVEILQAVTFINTEPVDAGGLRNDLTRTAKLRLPAGLQAARDSVSVRLKVIPAPGEITLAVAPQVSNLAEGLHANLQTTSISVRVRGELPNLRSLAPGVVRATVSAAGLSEGVHLLTPAVALPEGVTLVSTDPAQVVLVLSK